MNFLAHLYLSGVDDELMIGNFIADSVKGNDYKKFSPGIQKGIQLHRSIDGFTDSHPVVGSSKQRLRPWFGKHAGIVVDIFYDHFLSVDWSIYHTEKLDEFIRHAYIIMIQNYLILPGRVKQYLPFMVTNNWLEKYGTPDGIEKVLMGMSRRTSLPGNGLQAMQSFTEHYEVYRKEFNAFFPELRAMCSDSV
jgi:acyl carrier protein phosphodiesterase